MSVYKRSRLSGGKKITQWVSDNKIDGKQVRKIFRTQGEAQAHDVQVQAQQQGLIEQNLRQSRSILFSDFTEDFLSYSRSNNKPSAVYAKEWTLRLHLTPYFGAMQLDRIGLEEVEKYKCKKLQEKQSPKSINNHLAVLRKLLNLAVEYQKLSHAPRIKALKLGEQDFNFFTFEEAERFLAAAKPEWKMMLTLALKTGLRVGELLALKWADIDLHAGRLIVKATLWNGQENSPKGGKRREVPLSSATVALLKAARNLRTYVFTDIDGKQLSHSMVKGVVATTCKKAGLAKELTMHDLRHTFASHLVMRGRSLKEVQELLGHTTLAMTMRYAHLAPELKRDAVEALDGPTGPAQNQTAIAPA